MSNNQYEIDPDLGIAFLIFQDCSQLMPYCEAHKDYFGAYPAVVAVTPDLHQHIWEDHCSEAFKNLHHNEKPPILYLHGTALMVNEVLEEAWKLERAKVAPHTSTMN